MRKLINRGLFYPISLSQDLHYLKHNVLVSLETGILCPVHRNPTYTAFAEPGPRCLLRGKNIRFYSHRVLPVTGFKQEKSLMYTHKCIFQTKHKNTAAVRDPRKFSFLQFMSLSGYVTEE